MRGALSFWVFAFTLAACGSSSESPGGATGDCGVSCGPRECPCPSVAQVAVQLDNGHSFRIDAMETTNADYAVFARSASTSLVQRPVCSWNTSYHYPASQPYCASLSDGDGRA